MLKKIVVKNAPGEADTQATVIVKNNIDYVPLVSVIISVYNTSKYLRQCLDSVVAQTLRDIEIICVDDGSTDDSLDILREYATRDNRITILSQQNLYAGVARNAGIAVARGLYLSILDSDDFFAPDMLALMYERAVVDALDIVVCDSQNYDDATGKVHPNGFLKRWLYGIGSVFNRESNGHIFDFCNGWAWDKLFKTSFVNKHQIRFQGLRHQNDTFFVMCALGLAGRIGVVESVLVSYRVNNVGKISATRDVVPGCFITAMRGVYDVLSRTDGYGLLERSFINTVVDHVRWQMSSLSVVGCHAVYDDVVKMMTDFKAFEKPSRYFDNPASYNLLHVLGNVRPYIAVLQLENLRWRVETMNAALDALNVKLGKLIQLQQDKKSGKSFWKRKTVDKN